MLRDRSWREHHPDFTPHAYPDGTADQFCADCAEPCDVHFIPERWNGVLGVTTVSKCCGAAVVDEEGWQYESCDYR